MQEDDEQRWRDAMQRMGKPLVEAELQRRPGSPDDLIYDIVYSAPFPTRGFCEQWCIDTDNRLFRFSTHSFVILFVVLILIASVTRMVDSLTAPTAAVASSQTVGPASGSGTRAASSQGSPSSGTDPSSSPAIATSSYSSGSTTRTGQPAPSACAYITYDTKRCK